MNLPTLLGNINAAVTYGLTETIAITYKNYATCDDPSAEHTSIGAGYIPIHRFVKNEYTKRAMDVES